MPTFIIDSLDDPRLDDYRNIPDPELRASRGLFIVEGRLVVRRLLTESRFTTRSLLLTPAGLAGFADLTPDANDRYSDLPVYVVDPETMRTIAGFDVHRGCLAVADRLPPADWHQVAATCRTVVVLEQVGNPDNVGGVFRNAVALGADAVILGPGCADPLYRKTIRTSMGAALQVPSASMSDWPADLERLGALGFTLVGLTPSGSAAPIASWASGRGQVGERLGSDPDPSPRVALLLGHEGSGLSEAALRHVDVQARIPMSGGTDSLNVATAAAVALYELSRRDRERAPIRA